MGYSRTMLENLWTRAMVTTVLEYPQLWELGTIGVCESSFQAREWSWERLSSWKSRSGTLIHWTMVRSVSGMEALRSQCCVLSDVICNGMERVVMIREEDRIPHWQIKPDFYRITALYLAQLCMSHAGLHAFLKKRLILWIQKVLLVPKENGWDFLQTCMRKSDVWNCRNNPQFERNS